VNTPMRIVLVTQDSPFYLAENIDYFLTNLPPHSTVAGCVLFPPSPFGKKEGTLGKLTQTYSVFGLSFFLHYALTYIQGKIFPTRKVRHILAKHGVPAVTLTKSINSKQSRDLIQDDFRPDLIISIQANVIFKKPLIELPAKGCLNLHTALLPKYRGLMPTFWVMKNDEEETGVSVFFIDEGIDSGPIIVQKRVTIGNMSLDQLIRHTKRLGMDALIEAVDLIHRGNYQLIENDDAQKTYYSFPTQQDVKEFLRKGKRFF
jgi:methionyl-tRNA formyltransferase